MFMDFHFSRLCHIQTNLSFKLKLVKIGEVINNSILRETNRCDFKVGRAFPQGRVLSTLFQCFEEEHFRFPSLTILLYTSGKSLVFGIMNPLSPPLTPHLLWERDQNRSRARRRPNFRRIPFRDKSLISRKAFKQGRGKSFVIFKGMISIS